MQSRQRAVLVNAIWAIGGLSLGACTATVIDGRWTPEWVSATGTWFGAIATVLALLWAVVSFRTDQASREEARDEERARENASTRDREDRELSNATNVTIALASAGGQGGRPDEWQLSYVMMKITNTSRHPALVTALSLDPQLVLTDDLPGTFLVPVGDVRHETVGIELLRSPEGFDAAALAHFEVGMDYQLDGLKWHRSARGGPERR